MIQSRFSATGTLLGLDTLLSWCVRRSCEIQDASRYVEGIENLK